MSPGEVCEMQAEEGETPGGLCGTRAEEGEPPRRTMWDTAKEGETPGGPCGTWAEEGETPRRTASEKPVSASPLSVLAGALSSSLESEGHWIHRCSSFILCLDEALGPGADTHA